MTTTELVATPAAGTAVEVGFGKRSMTTQAETSASAIAAQQTAMVQAAYIMAERRPRDFDQIRVTLLKTCRRPRFAEAARYLKPVGKEKDKRTGEWVEKIAEGLSIRFAEEAARSMGNLRIDSYTVYDDPKKKIVKFVVLDLESNTEWSKTVTIEKTTERRQLKRDQQAIGQRMNSYSELVFVVEATQEEITKREGAEASKGWRDGILKNIPADIKEECLDKIRETILSDAAEDPEQKKKNMIDAFASIGVEPAHLREYVGHDLATLSPHEIVELRGVYASIKEGETTWAAVSETRSETVEKKGEPKKAEKPANGKPSADDAVKAAREKREAAQAAKAAGKTDPAAAISGPKAEPPTTTVAHDPKTGEVKGDFTISTSKQRTEIAQLATSRGIGIHEVCERYSVSSTNELSREDADEAIAWIKALPEVGQEPGSEG